LPGQNYQRVDWIFCRVEINWWRLKETDMISWFLVPDDYLNTFNSVLEIMQQFFKDKKTSRKCLFFLIPLLCSQAAVPKVSFRSLRHPL
jgi:hypothetical protein